MKKISPATRRLMQRLQADPGDRPTVWPTDELVRRLGIGGPPALGPLVQALQVAGIAPVPVASCLARCEQMRNYRSCYRSAPACGGKGFKWAGYRFAQTMAAEIFGTAAIFWVLIPVGLAGGALLLKLQGDD